MNYKLLLQYDGTDFHGWQVQNGQRTVQGELERTLSLIEDAPIKVVGSGRTDTGVHAEGQVANIHLNRHFTLERLQLAINGNVRRDVRVIKVEKVSEDFHARFSAKSKTYVYRVINAPVMSPFWLRYAHHEARFTDVGRMNETARLFLGEHDWTAFSAAQSDVENRVRTIKNFTVESVWDARSNSSVIEFRISADGFLRYMVRSIVGTLLEVGRGAMDFDTIQTAIVSGDRSLAGATAPANGLTLLKVDYE
ncbi:MAG: tRNA pseudouridine(38-40) synthase TruA [Pyrinomonadaceae bacterium]